MIPSKSARYKKIILLISCHQKRNIEVRSFHPETSPKSNASPGSQHNTSFQLVLEPGTFLNYNQAHEGQTKETGLVGTSRST